MRRWVLGHVTVLPLGGQRHRASLRDKLNDREAQVVSSELPARKLLYPDPNTNAHPKSSEKEDTGIPGDSFGLFKNRTVFYRPVRRLPPTESVWDDHFNPDKVEPCCCFNVAIARQLCYRFSLSPSVVAALLQEADGDINVALHKIETNYLAHPLPFGSYGVVALENYTPETFCLASYSLPTFESTRDDEVLDTLHEVTLSAAELPVDIPQSKLIDALDNWETEGGGTCGDALRSVGAAAVKVVLLPHGEYSAQGFHVAHPAKADTPNIGVGAAAVCLDLRSGIHNRFRFHVERWADSVSEHLVREVLHFGQDVHLFRQPFWFNPEYSVEEYIRFKESLLAPSAAVFEMRTAVAVHPIALIPPRRNLIEVENLLISQYKYEKNHEDFVSFSKTTTADGSNVQTAAAANSSLSAGTTVQYGTNAPEVNKFSLETKVGAQRRIMQRDLQSHGDRKFARFYRDNPH